MAKAANEDAPEEESAGAAPEEGAAAGGGKKKLILFGAIGLVALTLLGGGGYFFLRGKPDEAAEQQMAKKPVGFIEVRELTVNLAPEGPQDRTRLLKFKVALEVKDPKLIPDIQPLMPRVEDTFQVFIRELRASDLEGSGGLYRLREELLRRVNYAVYPAKVDAVLFKELVVQ